MTTTTTKDLSDGDRYDYDELSGIANGGGAPTPEKREPPPKNPDQAGGRNNYFASRAGKMRRDGFDADAILAAIRAENATRGYDLPDRELVTIANSIGAYEVGDTADAGTLDENIRRGIAVHGVRVDAVGRFRDLNTGAIARDLTTGDLTDLIWNDLRKVGKKIPAEDIGRILGITIKATKRAEYDKIAARILGRPETVEGIEELRRFVTAVAGTADNAVVGGFLQFMWCVKRSLAGLTREHDIMPILYNRIQGNGKSTAVRRLVSPMAELVDSITVETLADERKRADLGKFVVGVWDEMEGADKRDTDAIKNALSSQDVSYRPMRTNDNVTLNRIMNFIGTSNKPLAAMVRDSSGNRRFVEVETLPRLDHGTINAINYPLLWQAVSEHAEAPAKAVLGEIRTHQASGRFQDSVSLWLEAEDLPEGDIPCEQIRAKYTAWCERSDENSLPVAIFNNRLTAEGFRKMKRRVAGGRQWVFVVPARGVVPEVVPGDLDQENRHRVVDSIIVKDIGPMVHINNSIPQNQNPPIGAGPGPVGPVDQTTPWPAPPGEGNRLLVYDCEVFPNRFLCSIWNGTGWVEFTEANLPTLASFVSDPTLVLAGFNSHGYDDIILGAIARENYPLRSAAEIHKLSCAIIDPKTDADRDRIFKLRYRDRPWAYSIDVFQLLNGKGSLKEWECRIGFRTVAESPADFEKDLPDAQLGAVRDYCRNDVLATAEILCARWPLVELRETLSQTFNLGDRVYCLSEQGLAQTTLLSLHRDRTGENSNAVRRKAAEAPENKAERFPLVDIVSDRIQFQTDPFRTFLGRLRLGALVKGKSWGIHLEGAPLAETFRLGGCEVSLGVGGLHTVDKPGTILADDQTAIVDLDVTSYYPSLMIAEGVYPSQIGPEFLEDFAKIREKRIAAKKAGDKVTSEALKIVLNATFGKLNDSWSPIRSVQNAFKVTINGQLFLLMLMETLASKGFEILSANTDGVLIRCPRHRVGADLASVTAPWEKVSGLSLEQVLFRKVARRDINAYVAIGEDGKVKTKGPFNADAGKGDGSVIRDAAVAYLTNGTAPAETIAAETDPGAFLFYQRTKNGGDLYVGDQHLGKTARWYVTTDGPALRRKDKDGSHHTIPNGHHIALALDITGWTRASMPGLDLAHYEAAALALIRETDPSAQPKMGV